MLYKKSHIIGIVARNEVCHLKNVLTTTNKATNPHYAISLFYTKYMEKFSQGTFGIENGMHSPKLLFVPFESFHTLHIVTNLVTSMQKLNQ